MRRDSQKEVQSREGQGFSAVSRQAEGLEEVVVAAAAAGGGGSEMGTVRGSVGEEEER